MFHDKLLFWSFVASLSVNSLTVCAVGLSKLMHPDAPVAAGARPDLTARLKPVKINLYRPPVRPKTLAAARPEAGRFQGKSSARVSGNQTQPRRSNAAQRLNNTKNAKSGSVKLPRLVARPGNTDGKAVSQAPAQAGQVQNAPRANTRDTNGAARPAGGNAAGEKRDANGRLQLATASGRANQSAISEAANQRNSAGGTGRSGAGAEKAGGAGRSGAGAGLSAGAGSASAGSTSASSVGTGSTRTGSGRGEKTSIAQISGASKRGQSKAGIAPRRLAATGVTAPSRATGTTSNFSAPRGGATSQKSGASSRINGSNANSGARSTVAATQGRTGAAKSAFGVQPPRLTQAGSVGASKLGQGGKAGARLGSSTATKTRLALAGTAISSRPRGAASSPQGGKGKGGLAASSVELKGTADSTDDKNEPFTQDVEKNQGKPPSGTFLMPKVVKKWNVSPNQKFVIPPDLKITLPPDMEVMPSVQAPTPEQIEELRKFLRKNKLQQLKGLSKEQLKKLLAASKAAERVVPPPGSAEPSKPKPKTVSADRAKKTAPGEKPATLPAGLTSPFRYKPWTPVFRQRYAALVRPSANSDLSSLKAGTSSEQTSASNATNEANSGSATENNIKSGLLGSGTASGGTASGGTDAALGKTGAASGGGGTGAKGGLLGGTGQGAGEGANAKGALLGTGAKGAAGTGAAGQGAGSTKGGLLGGTGSGSGGKGVGGGVKGGLLGGGAGGTGGAGGKGAGAGKGRGGTGAGSVKGGLLGGAGGGGQGIGTGGKGRGGISAGGKGLLGGAGGGTGESTGGGAAGSGVGTGESEGFGAGTGASGAFNLGGTLDIEGLGADFEEADKVSTGYTPSEGVEPNLPASNPAAKSDLPGALVLPPLPPIGTPDGKAETPRAVKPLRIPSQTVPRLAAETPRAARPQTVRRAPQEKIETQPARVAPRRIARRVAPVQQPALVQRPTPVRPVAPRPQLVPRQNEAALTPPALGVGSMSERGTVYLPEMKRRALPLGTPSNSVNPSAQPSVAPRALAAPNRVGPRSVGEPQGNPQVRERVVGIRPVVVRRAEKPRPVQVVRPARPASGARPQRPAQTAIVAQTPAEAQTLRRLLLAIAELNGEAKAKKIKNSQGIKEGSYSPLPPLPLPDSDAEIGDGSGLKGEYFLGREFEQYTFTRADPNIEFYWGPQDSPNPRLPFGADYSIRWTGKIMPRYSEEYTFYATADDGMRLWVDHKLLIDNWSLHGGTEYQGRIKLEGGKQYDIRIDYFNGAPPYAMAYLYWESASQTKEFIPSNSLFYPLAGDKAEMSKDQVPNG